MTEDADSDDAMTESSQTRWIGTGTLLALLLVASVPVFLGLAGVGTIALSSIPSWLWQSYVILAGLAGVWTFGDETLKSLLEAWRTVRGK